MLFLANAAMIAILASDISPPLPKSDLYFQWGQDQLHRIMGLKGGRSYIIGVGKNWPKRPHHRSRYKRWRSFVSIIYVNYISTKPGFFNVLQNLEMVLTDKTT